MAEMAMYLKQLSDKIERKTINVNTGYDSTFGKNKRQMTVADVIRT